MTLRELTNMLQDLCHSGYSDYSVAVHTFKGSFEENECIEIKDSYHLCDNKVVLSLDDNR